MLHMVSIIFVMSYKECKNLVPGDLIYDKWQDKLALVIGVSYNNLESNIRFLLFIKEQLYIRNYIENTTIKVFVP